MQFIIQKIRSGLGRLTFSPQVFSHQGSNMHITHGSLQKKKICHKDSLTTWTCSFRTHIKKCLYSRTPLKGPRSCCGCEPCCPARSCGALACWCRTWPGCTGGPQAFLDHSRAPSSALWPSALSWCALSGPLRLMGTPCATRKKIRLDKICHHIFHHSSAHLDGLVAVGTVVNDGERLLKTGATDTNDICNQLTDGNDHLDE